MSAAGHHEEDEGGEAIDIGDVNGNATRGGSKPQPLNQVLTSAGRFAYCGLTTVALNHLFTDSPSDLTFALQTLRRLVLHLDLPEQVFMVMEMTVKGEVETSSAKDYVSILKDEPILKKSRVSIVQDLVMFAVQGGKYDARVRVLVGYVSCILHVTVDLLETFELSVLEYLTSEGVQFTKEEKKMLDQKNKRKLIKRYTLVGLATLGGGALLGLTGGLAAPLIGAGLGTIIGAGSAAALSSVAGMAVIGSLFGVAGAGLTGYKMKKRVGEVEEFSFDYLTEGRSLHITVAISGWLTKKGSTEEFFEPWKNLHNSQEQYCLRYESTYLQELGEAMGYMIQFALSTAVQESLKYTVLAGIISAITWPASLITLASLIDNPWGVCCRRSAQVGYLLAQVLAERQHGHRPVTLIGFSLGARVIYYCLQELVTRKDCAGIIQDVILLGAPVPGYEKDWKKFASVVPGRIINGYCQTDWLLRFLYRTCSASFRIAGLMPVEWKDRRMFNFDLSDIVTGHMDYCNKIDLILRTLGIRTREIEEENMKKNQSDQFNNLFLKRSFSDTQLLTWNPSPLPRSHSAHVLHISSSQKRLSNASSTKEKYSPAPFGNLEMMKSPSSSKSSLSNLLDGASKIPALVKRESQSLFEAVVLRKPKSEEAISDAAEERQPILDEEDEQSTAQFYT